MTGGGSLPGAELASWGLSITHPERSTAEVERALRSGEVAVIARIEDDRLLVDLRTVAPGDDERLGQLLAAALGR
jgi:L-seryl-tRNA(Ser) seleniumtransferase